MSDLTEGASIAVNGVCLTAVDLRSDAFSADLAPETLRRSNLGDLRPGSRVNLERPLLPTSRLSGHIVQGHVDGTGEFVSLDALGEDNWWRSINHYLTKYAHQPVETEQFRIAIEETTGQPMDWFFEQWVYKMGHPIFRVTQNYDPAKKTLSLTVTQEQRPDPESLGSAVDGAYAAGSFTFEARD